MAAPFHTYSPSCLLADEEPALADLYSLPTPPDVRSQFFYISSLPIDDPLAPLPPQTGQSAANENAPPQPFSARDNIALETAWHDLGKARQANNAGKSVSRSATSNGQAGIAVPGQRSSLEVERRRRNAAREDTSLASRKSTPNSIFDNSPSRNLKSRSGYQATSSDARRESFAGRSLSSLEGGFDNTSGTGAHRKRDRSTSLTESPLTKRRSSIEEDDAESRHEEAGSLPANRSRDASISGSPFIRAPIPQSYSPLGRSVESLSCKDVTQEGQPEPRSTPSRAAPASSGLRSTISLDQLAEQDSREEEEEGPEAKIPVGALRLHLVELAQLKVCAFPVSLAHCNNFDF